MFGGSPAEVSPHPAERSAPRPRDVVLKLFDDEFLLGDDVFHQVSDGDEADQLAAVHDGQMAQPVFRHQHHAFLARLIGSYIHDLGCHDIAHRRVF